MFDESVWNNMHTLSNVKKKVQVGNSQTEAQSERESVAKNRGVEKINNQALIHVPCKHIVSGIRLFSQ